MAIKITKKDIIWNYAGNTLNIGMGIFLLPIILLMLTTQEIGLWYVFASMSALVMLVDFGFSPTIMRNITYSWSGAEELLPEGTLQVDVDGKPNYGLLKSIITSSKKIYMILTIMSGILLFSLGTFYIYGLLPGNEMEYLVAWLIYALAIILNLYYSYWTPLLKGIGAIKEANQVLIISRLIYIMLSIIGLILGGGLVWLSLMYLVSGLLLRILSKVYFYRLLGGAFYHQDIEDKYNFKKIFTVMWPNAKKLGVVSIGAWMITRSTTLLCATYLGLEITAQYGLSLQILGIVGSFSSLLFNAYIPEIASSRVSHNFRRYNQIFSRAISLQWVVAIIGLLNVVILGPISLVLIGSNSTLLPSSILVMLGIVLFLEWNHSTFATLITMSNTVPFVGAAIYSGIGIVVISLVMLNFTTLGILGLIISQGAVQLAYNNWRWPRWVLKESNSSVFKILKASFNEIKGLAFKKKIDKST